MTVFHLRNRQRIAAIDRSLLRRIGHYALRRLAQVSDYELGVHLVGIAEMSRINLAFLNHAGPTDVITFDHREAPIDSVVQLFGEIFICPDEARANALRYHTTWQEEVVRYLVHGILHLQGYDDAIPKDRRRMKRRENQWLVLLAKQFPLSRIDLSNKAIS